MPHGTQTAENIFCLYPRQPLIFLNASMTNASPPFRETYACCRTRTRISGKTSAMRHVRGAHSGLRAHHSSVDLQVDRRGRTRCTRSCVIDLIMPAFSEGQTTAGDVPAHDNGEVRSALRATAEEERYRLPRRQQGKAAWRKRTFFWMGKFGCAKKVRMHQRRVRHRFGFASLFHLRIRLVS